ncbi:MAG: DinB family protein [Acidobacteriota bacterium]
MKIEPPLQDEFQPFASLYVDRVPTDGAVLDHLRANGEALRSLLEPLSDTQWHFRYAPGKWSVKEVLLHVIDTERILTYRALRVGRGDPTELSGFDQDLLMQQVIADHRSAASLLAEHAVVRNATLSLFESFDEAAWQRRGVVGGGPLSVRAVAYFVAGHELHHREILQRRYLASDAG